MSEQLTVAVVVGGMSLSVSGPAGEVRAIYAQFMSEVQRNIEKVAAAMAIKRGEVGH